MHTADQPAPTPRTDAKVVVTAGGDRVPAYFARQLERELAAIREALTGEDYASLPSDIPTVRMAHEIRSDRDKFLQQVRDTCSRAEKAERELSAANAECAIRNDEVSGLQGMLSEARAEAERLRVDAERLAYLTADHDDRDVRMRRNELLRRMPVMSHSAACAVIDLEISALATTRKEEGNG